MLKNLNYKVSDLVLNVFGVALLVLVAGCSNKFNLQEIGGTVTLDGKPAAGVAVNFVAQDPGGRDCGGYTNSQGVFKMTSAVGQGGDGTSPGKYKVTFEMNVNRNTLPESDPRRKMKPGDIDVVNALPDHYASAEKSEIEIEVVKGRNEFKFDLTSKK